MSLIAIFSDVHGNLPALKTILKDIKQRNADQLFCLGDLADFAPWTNEVIELMRALRIPCIMGNHDERIAFDIEVIPLEKHSPQETAARIKAINNTRATITMSNKQYLCELPRQILLTFKVKGKDFNIQLAHGSTRSISEYIYEDHAADDIYDMTDKHQVNVLVVGHTHISYKRELPGEINGGKRYVINSGSVGRSKEERQLATYVLLDVGGDEMNAEIIKLPYPVEETVAGILQSDIPDFYADFFNT